MPNELPRFRIATLLWLTALLASGATIEPTLGSAMAAMIAALACFVRTSSRAKRGEVIALPLVAAFGILLIASASLHTGHLGAIRCDSCARRMHDLAYAVRHHFNREGRLPDDVLDNEGTLKSWRTRFLNDLGDGDYYQGQNALSSDSAPPQCYDCYRFGDGYTTYYAIRGDGAVWPAAAGMLQPEMKDYDVDTALLIEADSSVVGEWDQPVDLSFDEAQELLTKAPKHGDEDGGHRMQAGFFDRRPVVARNVAFRDGSVRTLYPPLPPDLASAILTASGGEDVRWEIDQYTHPRFNYPRCFACVVFMLLTALPAWEERRKMLRAAA